MRHSSAARIERFVAKCCSQHCWCLFVRKLSIVKKMSGLTHPLTHTINWYETVKILQPFFSHNLSLSASTSLSYHISHFNITSKPAAIRDLALHHDKFPQPSTRAVSTNPIQRPRGRRSRLEGSRIQSSPPRDHQ